MTMISDEIRELIDDEDLYPRQIAGLRRIADRIDAEMMKLPRDRDGAPIHVGDTVYLDDGRKAEVTRIDLMPTNTCIVCWTSDKKDVAYLPSAISHKQTDSLERIADDIDSHYKNHTFISDDTIHDWAVRIRRLAKKEGEQCQ